MNSILPQFQKFMADRHLAVEKQIPFYAGWASKFILFSNARNTTPSDLKIQLFLDDLKKSLDVKEITEDDESRLKDQLQKTVDEFNKEIDTVVEKKKQDLMSV